MPRIAVVGISGGWSSEKLVEAVEAATGHRLLVEMKNVRMDLDSGRAFFHGVDLTTLDAMIIKKVGARYSPDLLDRLEMLRYLCERGLKMFSSPLSIMNVLDRISCTVTLKLAGIPMPETTITEDVDEALRTVEEYEAAVFKPVFTSKARGMCLVDAGPGARDKIEAYKQENPIMYIQKRIHHKGRDLGVTFLGGAYLNTYARCNDGNSWNTTTAFGGKYRQYDPPDEVIKVAEKAQALFDLDFTSVDVAETDDGPLVFEVSAFGGFRGIRETTSIDPARKYVDYVITKLMAS